MPIPKDPIKAIEWRKNQSKAHLGQPAWNKGKKGIKLPPRTEEYRKKLSEKMKGRILSDITKEKIRKMMLGKKHSEETKQKMSKSHIGKNTWMKGRHLSLETRKLISKKLKGINSWSKGIKLSPETCKKMSEANKGEKGSGWKGGINPINDTIRKSFEYNFWRKSCFSRDNFTDAKTGISGGDLVVHHINNFSNFPELRFTLENGITLSKESHKLFHHIYGVKNNTKEQLEEFLSTTI